MNFQRWNFGRGLAAVLLLATLAVAGCGRKTVTVTGMVRYKQRPLSNGTVSFFGETGEIASALISADGRYRLTGLRAGPVRVAVVSHPPVPPGFQFNLTPAVLAPALPKTGVSTSTFYSVIPRRYSQPENSGLSFDLVAGEQTFDLDLSP